MTHVMICSDENQPIQGSLRYRWLCEIFNNYDDVEIIWCQDENPQYPHECDTLDEFYGYWVPSVYSRIKHLDAVFTSESYGDEFARYLGIEHICVDQPRSTYAVSATAIRNEPLKNWEFIPINVRSYFTKRVVVMGPESTGKSTLVKNLAKHFESNYVPEYGRTYTETSGINNLNLIDFELIALGHGTSLDKTLIDLLPTKYLFSDTEAMTTKIFCEMYLGECESKLIEEMIKYQYFDLYLLLDVDVPWVNDGTRNFPNAGQTHLDRLKKELTDRNIPYTLISGNFQERFDKAVKEVEKL